MKAIRVTENSGQIAEAILNHTVTAGRVLTRSERGELNALVQELEEGHGKPGRET